MLYIWAQFLTVFIFTGEFVDNTDNIIRLTVISQHVDVHAFILFTKLFIIINNHFYKQAWQYSVFYFIKQ